MVENSMNQISQEVAKATIAVQKDAAIGSQRQTRQMQLIGFRALEKEKEMEIRRQQVEVVTIDVNGSLSVQTQNLRIEAQPRKVANFVYAGFAELRSAENDERLFVLQIKINGTLKNVLILPNKIGSATYVLRKLREQGGEIYAFSSAEKKNYICQIMATLMTRNYEIRRIPKFREWFLDDGEIKFYNRELTWREAKKCSE